MINAAGSHDRVKMARLQRDQERWMELTRFGGRRDLAEGAPSAEPSSRRPLRA